MSYFSYKLDMSGWGIQTALEGAARKAEHAVAVEVSKDTDKYVPMRTGYLKNTARPENVKDNRVIYDAPYARYLYFGKVMVYEDPPYLRRRADGKAVLTHYGQKKVKTEKDLNIRPNRTSKNAQAFWLEASEAQNLDKWKRAAAKAVRDYVRK